MEYADSVWNSHRMGYRERPNDSH